MDKKYYTYIMANERPTLYTGMTNNLIKRGYDHKKELIEGFTKKYHLHKLVYFEVSGTAIKAIAREKHIKNMNRNEKLGLIRSKNPEFKDLYKDIVE